MLLGKKFSLYLVVVPTWSSRYNMSLDIGSWQLEMAIAYGSEWVHGREKSRVQPGSAYFVILSLRIGEDSEERLPQRV